MNTNFLQVDHKATIDLVSKKAMLRSPENIYDFIVITNQGQYFGITTVKDLLEKVIEIEVANAKNLNPLSELPGNSIIEMQLERLISMEKQRYVLYFDVDNFKAYNDYYGFENGDNILKSLTKNLKKHTPPNAFLGHIGGDDFIAIVEREQIDNLCENVIADFDNLVASFYQPEDADRGYIVVKNRNSIEETFPLVSLSIVAAYSGHCSSIYELAERASKLKKICKQQPGSNYLIEEEVEK